MADCPSSLLHYVTNEEHKSIHTVASSNRTPGGENKWKILDAFISRFVRDGASGKFLFFLEGNADDVTTHDRNFASQRLAIIYRVVKKRKNQKKLHFLHSLVWIFPKTMHILKAIKVKNSWIEAY